MNGLLNLDPAILNQFDPAILDQLRAFGAQMGPTEEERAEAKRQAMLMAALAMMGGRKGDEWSTISRAALGGVMDYRDSLGAISKSKREAFGSAGEAMKLAEALRAMKDQQRYRQGEEAARLSNTNPGMASMGPPTASGEMQPAVPPSFNMAGYADSLAAVDPFKALQIKQAMVKELPYDKPKPEHFTPESLQRYTQSGKPGDLRPITKAEGAWVDVGERNGQIIQRHSLTGELRAVGSRPPITNVNLPSAQTEEDKAIGKARGEGYVSYVNEAKAQSGKLRQIAAIENLLAGVDTNSLTPIGMRVAGAARAVGIELDPQLPAKQAAETVTNKLALDARSTAEGGGMPGAMSDADREFLLRSVLNLTQTPDGRKKIIDVQRRLARRSQEMAALAAKYRNERGTFDEGFQSYAEQYFANKPLFEDMAGSAPVNATMPVSALPKKNPYSGLSDAEIKARLGLR